MRCCVPYCLNTSDNISKSTAERQGRDKQLAISFHRFPKESHLRAAWLKALGKRESHLGDTAVVCSKHFLHDDVCVTKSGSKLLRRGAVPSTVQVCMVCLDTHSQMFLMRKHKFDETYEKLTGHPLWDGGNLKQTLCVQCAQRLRNFSRFREQSLRARSLMMELLEKHELITLKHIKTIKRELDSDFSYHYDLYKVEPEDAGNKTCDDEDKVGVKSALSDDSTWEFDDVDIDEDDDGGSDGEVFESPVPRGKCDPLWPELTIKNDNEEYSTLMKTEHQIVTNDDGKESSDNKEKYNYLLVEVGQMQDGETERTMDSFDNQNISNIKYQGIEDNAPNLSTEHRTETKNYYKQSSENKKINSSCADKVEPMQDDETEKTINYSDSIDNQDIGNALEDAPNLQVSETLEKLYNQSIERENETDLTDNFRWESDLSDCTLSSISWGDEVFTCDVCQKTFREKRRLIKHIKVHTDANEKMLSCELCDYKFRYKRQLEKHLRIHAGGKLYSCVICSREFALKSSLDRHSKKHDASKYLTCIYCPYKTSRHDHLLNHMKIHTGVKRFACELCTYKCFHNSDLVQHMRTHTGEKPFACQHCDLKFAKSYTLKMHTLRVHDRPGESPFSCNICDYKCYYQTRMIEHMKTHTTKQTFSCQHCEYTCQSETRFKWHTKKHTAVKYLACEFCDYTGQCKSQLIRHIRTHTGERMFKCETCNRAFVEKSKLTRHMKIHTGEKPFACASCPYRCSRKCHLVNHMKTHTRENRFSCEKCSFKCAGVGVLTRHMRIHK